MTTLSPSGAVSRVTPFRLGVACDYVYGHGQLLMSGFITEGVVTQVTGLGVETGELR